MMMIDWTDIRHAVNRQLLMTGWYPSYQDSDASLTASVMPVGKVGMFRSREGKRGEQETRFEMSSQPASQILGKVCGTRPVDRHDVYTV